MSNATRFDPKSRARWLHFCVAFIPVYLDEGAEMVKGQPEHAEAHALMCVYYEKHQVLLREAMRREDPDLFALYHPGDAAPEWMRDVEEEGAVTQLFDSLDGFATDTLQWGLPNENGEYEWRLGPLFGHSFEHDQMPRFGLPRRYEEIDWRDPRQSRNWLRFCVWFLPLALTAVEQQRRALKAETREELLRNFHKIARILDQALPREKGEMEVFET